MSADKYKAQAQRPVAKVVFDCSKLGDDQYFTTPAGLQVCITRQGLHKFNFGVIDPVSRLSEYIAIRMLINGADSTISTRLASKEAVAIMLEMKHYSDQVLISYVGGRANEMLLFVREQGNIHGVTMIVFEGHTSADNIDTSQFILQGKA